VAGAVIVGVLGAGLATLFAVSEGARHSLVPVAYMGGMVGTVMGTVLAPLAAWTLMRRVPLWRAIAETAAGTIIGTLVGFILVPTSPPLVSVAGFVVAAIRLRVSTSRSRRPPAIDARAG
jgi:hypothetical protein